MDNYTAPSPENDRPEADPDSMSMREMVTVMVLPRLDRIEAKVDVRMNSFEAWRARVNGIAAVLVLVGLPLLTIFVK